MDRAVKAAMYPEKKHLSKGSSINHGNRSEGRGGLENFTCDLKKGKGVMCKFELT